MKIEKKRYIRRIKLRLKLRHTRYQINAISSISWTKFNRHLRLVLGISKLLYIRNSLVIKYFGLSVNLSKWNNFFINPGSNSILNPFNKGVKLENPLTNLKPRNVITSWSSGKYLVNKKSGSKKFVEWSSNKLPNKKSQVRDLVYRESYVFLIPYFTKTKSIKSKLSNVSDNSVLLKNNLSITLNNTINFL